MIDRRSRAIAVALVLAPLVSSCSPNAPGATDSEVLALDVEACAQGIGCTTVGAVSPVESLLPGNAHALLLQRGGAVGSLLQTPAPKARLAYLVLGLHARGDIDLPKAPDGTTPVRRLDVAITGLPTSIVHPLAGWARIEIAEPDTAPEADATIEIIDVEGEYELDYVVGRFRNP